MLTDTQSKGFKDVKEAGKLSPKQKADFYFRMSKILKEQLEKIRDAVYLLNEIPDSYLEKIDFAEAAIDAMQLSETVLKKMQLPTVQPTFNKTKIQAVKSFDLGEDNLKLPPYEGKEMAVSIIGLSVICDLTEDENKIINQVLEHIRTLRDTLTPTREKVSGKEFDIEIWPRILGDAEKKGVKCEKGWEYAPGTTNSLTALLETAVSMKERRKAAATMNKPPE